MDFTISLAHFCEFHGPTSIICTQASISPCSTCNSCVTPPSEDQPSSSAYPYNGLYDQPMLKLEARIPSLSSPFETPPTSPRSPSHNPYFPSFPSSDGCFPSRRASSTYDSDPDVCENCQFVVPKQVSDRLPTGAPGSPSKDGQKRNGSPVLRSSQNFAVRRPSSSDGFSSSSESSDVSDSEPSRSCESRTRSYPDSIPASPMSMSRTSHTHTLNYISANQPLSPTSYSQLRRTVINTFSNESLPMGKSSGSMMFGDCVAGYTIAYVFRLQDPRSRGMKRTYALIAMAGRDCRRASRAMVKVIAVFESIANRIISLAEKVLERESASAQAMSRPPMSRPATAFSSVPTLASPTTSAPSQKLSSSAGASSTTRNITPVSSFLSAKKVDPDGFPRMSRDIIKAKSLIEIVGMENFFPELHALFCGLLKSLIKEFGT
ncbi:hypothetical protein K504DRAFT_436907 [Pleomassaria siparia CBS 279.74]|uniref:UDENN FLCN/SMCR8-type domain-containing protein n=1 Tax=Pleomassaria siparia CBS 279.74 TaxID=1314801 RepID=A0A6G1K4K8_9PLEO|nr:hypothetical protein K504DRAFT_436907 [Pleomassaria siparia CBS 279.74]